MSGKSHRQMAEDIVSVASSQGISASESARAAAASIAQVYATLALVEAVDRLTDAHNRVPRPVDKMLSQGGYDR